MNMKNRKIKIALLILIILAAVLRIYKLDQFPPSLTWDEAAVGYNAWTIASYGRDEYGKFLPTFFRSFADDKHPVHIYITAIFVKLFGLNDLSVRLPSACFGVLNVLLLFFLAKLLFKRDVIAFSAASFLAISPYNIHFSRFNHEANFALFFFMLGLILFYLFLVKKRRLLPYSVLSFAVCFITYHPAKIIVPIVIILLSFLYFKQLLRDKVNLIIALCIGLFFLVFIVLNPQLLGLARVQQTTLDRKEIEKTLLFKLTNNESLGHLNLVFTQYSWHLKPDFLFIHGDENPRLSSNLGEFYTIDGIFLISGIFSILYRRSKEGFVLLGWALIAPLPSALVAEAPHAARSMFMMGSWHLISALGFYSLITLVPNFYTRVVFSLVSLLILTILMKNYLHYYYGEFARRYAIDWQYGMKQIAEYINKHDEITNVFMTDTRSQPYIFFLYNLKIPLPDYLNTVIYNNSISRSYNNVIYFNKYFFGGELIESKPEKGNLYILNPSEYDGLRYKSSFDIKEVIHYPNEMVAFYVITAK